MASDGPECECLRPRCGAACGSFHNLAGGLASRLHERGVHKLRSGVSRLISTSAARLNCSRCDARLLLRIANRTLEESNRRLLLRRRNRLSWCHQHTYHTKRSRAASDGTPGVFPSKGAPPGDQTAAKARRRQHVTLVSIAVDFPSLNLKCKFLLLCSQHIP